MTEDAQARHAVDQLLAVLDLADGEARTTEDIFTGISHHTPWGRIYGGQVVAQSVIAAQRTLPADRVLHSLHGYFLRPGDARQGVTLAVDRIHDGRSFATRRTQAFQNGVPIWSMIASFQDADPGLEHSEPMPEGIPIPESLTPDEERTPGIHGGSRSLLTLPPIEVRHVEQPIWGTPDPTRSNRQHVWMRMRARLPEDAALHRAALAYMSDTSIQEPVLRAHGLCWQTEGLKVASLDHAMWWHRFARADEWLLHVQESPNARGGRGLGRSRVYTRDGILVATISQEIMLRVPELF